VLKIAGQENKMKEHKDIPHLTLTYDDVELVKEKLKDHTRNLGMC
jgi:hypothetical protein